MIKKTCLIILATEVNVLKQSQTAAWFASVSMMKKKVNISTYLDGVSDKPSDSFCELSVRRNVEGVEPFPEESNEVRREGEESQKRRHRKRRRTVAIDTVDAIDF